MRAFRAYNIDDFRDVASQPFGTAPDYPRDSGIPCKPKCCKEAPATIFKSPFRRSTLLRVADCLCVCQGHRWHARRARRCLPCWRGAVRAVCRRCGNFMPPPGHASKVGRCPPGYMRDAGDRASTGAPLECRPPGSKIDMPPRLLGSQASLKTHRALRSRPPSTDGGLSRSWFLFQMWPPTHSGGTSLWRHVAARPDSVGGWSKPKPLIKRRRLLSCASHR